MSSISSTGSSSYLNTLNQSLSSSLPAKAQQSLTPAQKLDIEIKQMTLDAFTSSDSSAQGDTFSALGDALNSSLTSSNTNTTGSKGQDSVALRQELQQMSVSSSLETSSTSNGTNSLLDITA